MWAKQSTAATLIIGPILDSTGAEYASAVIGDISISKNGATLTALASAATLTYIANGQYTLVTTTGNTDTLGRAQFTCNKSTYQMPSVFLMVLPATVYDALVTNAAGGANGLVLSLASNQVNVGQLLGSATPVTNLNTIFNTDYATVYDTTNKAFLSKLLSATQASIDNIEDIVASSLPVTLNYVTMAAAIWSDNVPGDFTVSGSIGKALFTNAAPGAAGGHFLAGTNAATVVTTSFTTTFTGNLTGNVGGSVGSVATGVTVTANNDKTGYGLSSAAIQAIWDAATSALTTAGSIGKRLVDFVTTLVYVAPTTPPTAGAIASAVWQDTTAGDFTVSGSIGKSIMNGVSLGTGLTIVSVSGNIGGISGTTQTLDALQTALNLAHGAGSWATATGFSTLTAGQALAAWQAALLPNSSKTYGNAMELLVSAAGGVGLSSGAASSGSQTWVVRNLDDSDDLLSVTNDGLGNRSIVTWTP